MPRYRCTLVAGASVALLLAACSDDSQSRASRELEERLEKRTELRKRLIGTWARPVRTADSLWEGLRLDPDGRVGLFGIHTLHGLQWLVRGDTLVLTTSSQRYAEPQESRLKVEFPGDQTLVLLAEQGYWAGVYDRAEGMALRVTGMVSFRLPGSLGHEAALFLELRGVAGDSDTCYLASQTLPAESRRSPLPFHLYYASPDAAAFRQGLLLVTLVVDGVPQLSLAKGYPVGLGDDAEGLDVWLDEPES